MIQHATKLRLNLERRNGWARSVALFDMGPPLYCQIILDHVFQNIIPNHEYCGFPSLKQSSGDKEFFEVAREAMVRSEPEGIIITKKETGCGDNLLVENMSECFYRQELYDAYKMKPWKDAVDSLWAYGQNSQ